MILAVWKNLFRKRPRLLNLEEMVTVWKVIKPYCQNDIEPYTIAEFMCRVAPQKAERVYRIFYGEKKKLPNSLVFGIALGIAKNNFDEFVSLVRVR